MTINFNTLFAYIGQNCKTAEDTYAAYNDSIEPAVRAFQDSLDAEDQEFQYNVNNGIESGLSSLASNMASGVSSTAASPTSRLIVETVHADVPLRSKSITAALDILIDQMDDNAESVDASTVTTSIEYGEGGSSSGIGGDNTGTGVIVVCTKRGDGLVNEFILSEDIRCEITSISSNGSARWKLTGEPSVSKLSVDWPSGSAISTTITSLVGVSGSNLVTNGTFSDEDDTADYLPEGWILSVGVLGTTILVTDIEIQTVTINGDPTGGHYTLTYTDNESRSYTTVPLAYNAAASAVQSALQSLPFLGSVTVSTTGDSPNYTHSVTFLSVNVPPALTYTDNLTGGTPTITIQTPTPSSAGVMRGDRALEFNGDGAELTTIQVAVTLSATKVYCVNVWALVDATPAAGVMTVDLIDGIGGTVVADDQATDNTFTIDLTDRGTYPEASYGCFRTPTDMPAQIYLRLRLSTALSNTTSLFIDEVVMASMTELYAGGPFIAAFSGADDFVVGDEAVITVVNGREGALHEYLNRFLTLDGKRLLLPTETNGTQDDSLIA